MQYILPSKYLLANNCVLLFSSPLSPVQANDGQGSHTANVRVSVRDANNNVPVFSKNPYLAAVQENAAKGEFQNTYLMSVCKIG